MKLKTGVKANAIHVPVFHVSAGIVKDQVHFHIHKGWFGHGQRQGTMVVQQQQCNIKAPLLMNNTKDSCILCRHS